MATRRRRDDDQPAGADATATTGQQAKKAKPSPGVSLPEELIREVLLRLPARSLARLRCVRRSWDADITSADFVDRHLALAAAKPKIAFVPVGDDHRFLARWHQHMHLDQPFAVPMECGGCPRLVGAKACHGLVLVERRCGSSDDPAAFLSVCNPSTGGTMDLPALYRQAQSGVHVVAGIGFHAPAGQYKVVAHLRTPLSPRCSEAVPEAYCVVTLGVDRGWRFRFRPVPGHDDSALRYAFVDGGPVFADGCLHWTCSESSSDDDVRVTRGILSFSLSDESFRQAPQPAFPAPDAAGAGKCSVVSSWREARGRPVGCLGTATLAELGGSLCLVRDVRGCRGVVHGQLQVWKLEDYGAGSWSLEHRVDVPGRGPQTPWVAVVPCGYLYSRSGGGGGDSSAPGERRELLIVTTREEALVYDPRTCTLCTMASPAGRGEGGGDWPEMRTDCMSLVVYQESLVHFDGMRYGDTGVKFVELGCDLS